MSSEKEWLEKMLKTVEEEARLVLGLLERRKELEPGDELDDLEGYLYARLLQLELDAKHARDASDAYTDSLPGEAEPVTV